ncbi:MAG: GNAT family N-acetyltransferase [Pseudomonadota bacterium]
MKKYIYFSFLIVCSFVNAGELENDAVEEKNLIPRSLSDSNIIRGEYIFLRPTFPNDYLHFVSFYADPLSIQYLGNGRTKTEDQLIEIFNKSSAENTKQYPDAHHWTICAHDGVAGKMALLNFCGTNVEKTEIAYYIDPKYQGRNYAIRASKLGLSFAAENWPDNKPFYIEATVHPENHASISVLKNLSFMRDAKRLAVPKYGSIRDYYEVASYEESILSKKTLNQRLIEIVAFKVSVLAIVFLPNGLNG